MAILPLSFFRSNGQIIAVVLLDMTLPELSGPRGLREIAADLARWQSDSHHRIQSGDGDEGHWRTAVLGLYPKALSTHDLVHLIQNACVKKNLSGRATG